MAPVAPPIEGQNWLNVAPLQRLVGRASLDTNNWSAMRGHPMAVVFWSFGCEASLLQLRRLATVSKEKPELVVVCVHTPRFPYEDNVENLARAVERNRIELPVVHDPEYVTWNRYNPGGWPATIMIDRRGKALGILTGPTNQEDLTDTVNSAVQSDPPTASRLRQTFSRAKSPKPTQESAETSNTNRSPLTPDPKPAETPNTKPSPTNAQPTIAKGNSAVTGTVALGGPTSVASNDARLAIADTGNDRILVGLLGSDLRKFEPDVAITGISMPTGLVFRSTNLLCCIEKQSGRVVEIDLLNKTGRELANELSAPSSLHVDLDDSLVVTDPGAELILRIDLSTPIPQVGAIAGSGRSGLKDGKAGFANLAQPIDADRRGDALVFCDAASSNIRMLTDDGKVVNVTNNSFFDFGLTDGPIHSAHLQRPSSIACLSDGSMLIADTGNNRIRRLKGARLKTLGLTDLNQPSSIATLGDNHALVADTGNDRIVLVEPDGKSAWPLTIGRPSATVSLKQLGLDSVESKPEPAARVGWVTKAPDTSLSSKG